MSTQKPSEEDEQDSSEHKPPTKREAQGPIGPVAADDSWVSGEEKDDSLREEAAERASRAVEPGRPRE